MGKPLRVILVEDSLDDSDLTLRALAALDFSPVWRRVEDAAALRAVLMDESWDLVLSDFHLPRFSGLGALEVVKETGKDIPFIMLTGTIGEDNAAAIMKAGADDFVLKDRTARLGPAIDRALQDARTRAERRRAIRELDETNHDLSALISASPLAIIVIDSAGLVRRWNRSAGQMFGWQLPEQQGHPLFPLRNDPADPLRTRIQEALRGKSFIDIEGRCRRKFGPDGDFMLSLAPLLGADQSSRGVLIIASDITQRKVDENRDRHAVKMESIGHLSAGIAHEIKTPLQFIGDNLRFLQQSGAGILEVFAASQGLCAALRAGGDPAPLLAAARTLGGAVEGADLEYLTEEIPKAIAQALDGVDRVTTIVKALKEFSHPDSGRMLMANLRQVIESTLNVARNEYKYVAEIVTHFDPDLPDVECVQGEISQVVLNLVVNAAHAIADLMQRTERKGTITVSTHLAGGAAEIRIADTGTGIPEAAQPHIFDPFFTTKEVGKGTGQGLAMAHTIVVKNHRGGIAFETAAGVGTTFIVTLPLKQEPR
jgi:PAS domain S-box-containing protein